MIKVTKLVTVFLISVIVLLTAVYVLANNEQPELLPEEPSIPGEIQGTGTYFEIKDSEYLNIILESTEEIKIVLESIPKMISLNIEVAKEGIDAAELTISGLEPNKTYYKYQDSYKNEIVFISDENGICGWEQDLSQSHHIWLQEIKGTTFIDKDTVLDHDIIGSVEITADNITLDCANHSITGNKTGYGIYLNTKTNITIQNCIITDFSDGTDLHSSSNNTLTSITANLNSFGIVLSYSSNNNQLTNITANSNYEGILLYSSSNNNIYKNNFNNSRNVYSYNSINTWNSPEKINYIYNTNKHTNYLGNYWNDYNGSDTNSDGIGDSSYAFTGGQDNYPLKMPFENYFEVPANQPPTISNLGQFKSDGIISITEGNTTTESTVVFKAVLSDPDNDQAKLQIELRQFNEPFTGIDDGGILNSDFVNSGNEATITQEGLINGQYHWRARAVDSQGNISEWQEFGTAGNIDFEVQLPLTIKAAELSKLVIDAPYLGDGVVYGGKGWDYKQALYVPSNDIFSGYNYWNNKLRTIAFGAGLDCSGLVQWAFNRSFDPQKSLLHNVIRYDGADGQYKHNSEKITEADLQLGDLLFLDKDTNGKMDHVAMYVGDNGTFDIVEAFSPARGIIPSSITEFKERPGFVESKHIRRVVLSPSIGGQVKVGSPIDLIVTDPDGFTIAPTTAIQTDEEYLREVPGELYYTENVMGVDERPEDIVYWPKQKTGDYIIKVLPEAGVSPTETYTLEFQAGEEITVLAENIPMSEIPSEGYGVAVQEIGVTSIFIPVSIDIKPDSYPNSINFGSRGTVPVTIFGSNTFDVHQINLNSIIIAGAPIKPKKNSQLMASYNDINGDGLVDVVVHIATEVLQLSSSDVKAELNGFLLDGRKIKGSDSVKIVP